MSAVMWQIRRVRLDRIGAPAARFLDVTFELTNAAGHPLDTILWLRNGGGKSTVLSLICALVRPHRRDFLATSTTDKHLEDYVLGADTAHVTIEWSGPDGKRLITGAVYEWADRTQPADPNRDHHKLQARWYTFTHVPGRAELTLLPFTTEGEPTPLKEFAAAVRGWAAIPGCEAVVTDVQERWAETLDDHGLDPELFTAILQMNATEGGIESQFQFRNADEFVRYLLELIVDPDTPRQVSTILEKVRARLAERPAILADLAFADEAVPLLRRLATARRAHADAAATHTAALADAQELRAALAAAVERATADAQTHAESARVEGERELAERRAGDTAYNRSVEFRRIAAVYRQEAAERHREDVIAEQRDAQAELDAWAAVPRLAALAQANRRVRNLQAELDAATLGAEPRRIRRDEAAGVLAGALDAATAEQEQHLTAARTRREQQQGRADEAKKTASRLTGDRGQKTARLELLTDALTALDADIAAAAAAGHLSAGEDLTSAAVRHRAADEVAGERLTEIGTEKEELRQRRRELAEADRELRENRQRLQHERRVHVERRTTLTGRIDDLAGNDRLRLLGETDDLDVLAEGGDLHRLLTEQITRADQRRIELGVEGAEDERAVAALTASGLLPPVLDVVRALTVLDDERIAATSGWAYLADAVPGPLRGRVLAAAPALVGGVLVHDPIQLTPAQHALSTAALRPTSAVTVATTADLHAVVETVQAHSPPAAFVVPPAPALFDKAAAGEELRLRELARDDRASQDDGLARQRTADDELRRQLRALLDDCPPGTLETLAGQIDGLDEQLRVVDEQLEALRTERDGLDRTDAELEEQRTTAERTRRAAAAALAVLAGLSKRVEAAGPQRAEAEALPAQIAELTAALRQAEDEEQAALLEVEAARSDVTARTAAVQAYRAERTGLGDVAATVTTTPLDDARAQWEVADAAYRAETSGSALAAQLEEAQRAVPGPAAEVATLPPDRLQRAEELFATPDGRDPQLRVAATEAAEAAVARLREERAAADLEVKLAEGEVAEYTPIGRRGRVIVDEANKPPTREAALAAAQATDAERERHLAAENEAQTKAAQSSTDATAAEARAESLRPLLLLLGADEGRTAGEPVPPYSGSLADARVAAVGLQGTVQNAREEETRRARALQEVSNEVVVWANDPRFHAVKDDVRGRFRVTNAADELGPGADTLADDLHLYAANLRGQLAELDEHKRTVVTAMTGMVRQALRALARAQSMSELPTSLPGWAGQRFLEVGPRASVDTSDVIVADRCARLVDALTSRGAEVPRGVELLWQATSAVVGDGNWKARVLKPSTTFAIDRVPVEKMRKWSGGEKVTISLLLFSMVVKLRAANRGRDLPGLGTLPLDNPLGKANYVVFLDLQRKVATANGVQLLFLTGVGDMKAVGRFPNIIRMRNTPSGGREYVRIADRQLADDDPAGVVDSTRVWRDDPVMKLL